MERVSKTTRVWGYDNLYPSLSRSIAKTGETTRVWGYDSLYLSLSRCTAKTGKTTRVLGYDNLYLTLSRSIAKTGHQTCRNEPDAAILEYYKVFELSLPPLSLVLLFWTMEITVQIYQSSGQ